MVKLWATSELNEIECQNRSYMYVIPFMNCSGVHCWCSGASITLPWWQSVFNSKILLHRWLLSIVWLLSLLRGVFWGCVDFLAWAKAGLLNSFWCENMTAFLPHVPLWSEVNLHFSSFSHSWTLKTYGIVINFLLSLGSSAWAWHHCSGRQTLSDGSDWFIEEEKKGSRTQCFQVVWSYTSSWNSVQRRLWRMLCGVLLSMLFGQDFLACHRTRCILQARTTLWTVDGRLENNFFFVRIYIHFT